MDEHDRLECPEAGLSHQTGETFRFDPVTLLIILDTESGGRGNQDAGLGTVTDEVVGNEEVSVGSRRGDLAVAGDGLDENGDATTTGDRSDPLRMTVLPLCRFHGMQILPNKMIQMWKYSIPPSLRPVFPSIRSRDRRKTAPILSDNSVWTGLFGVYQGRDSPICADHGLSVSLPSCLLL